MGELTGFSLKEFRNICPRKSSALLHLTSDRKRNSLRRSSKEFCGLCLWVRMHVEQTRKMTERESERIFWVKSTLGCPVVWVGFVVSWCFYNLWLCSKFVLSISSSTKEPDSVFQRGEMHSAWNTSAWLRSASFEAQAHMVELQEDLVDSTPPRASSA